MCKSAQQKTGTGNHGKNFSTITLTTDCSVDSKNSQLCPDTSHYTSLRLFFSRVNHAPGFQPYSQKREDISGSDLINIINNLQNICLCRTVDTQKNICSYISKIRTKSRAAKEDTLFLPLLAFSNPPSIF